MLDAAAVGSVEGCVQFSLDEARTPGILVTMDQLD
jgi:hypothetical protein